MSTFQRLEGQVALVTGSGSAQGIGFAAARALADDGAAVVLSSTTDRVHDRVAELTALGYTVLGVVADLMEALAGVQWHCVQEVEQVDRAARSARSSRTVALIPSFITRPKVISSVIGPRVRSVTRTWRS